MAKSSKKAAAAVVVNVWSEAVGHVQHAADIVKTDSPKTAAYLVKLAARLEAKGLHATKRRSQVGNRAERLQKRMQNLIAALAKAGIDPVAAVKSLNG